MSYLHWSNSPFYVYWCDNDELEPITKEQEVLRFDGFSQNLSFTYEDLKTNLGLCLAEVLKKQTLSGIKPREIRRLLDAVTDFMEDVDSEYSKK